MWLVMILNSLLIGLGIVHLSKFISKKKIFLRAAPSPFECGASTLWETQLPLSVPFFILSLVFLVFDMELIILFPYLLLPLTNSASPVISVMLFLNFLVLSVILELLGGILDWMYFI